MADNKLEQIFESIKSAKGNDKQVVIAQNKDNNLFVDVLKFIYDPYFVTHIAKKKLSKKLDDVSVTYDIANIVDLMNFLHNCTGKDTDVKNLQHYMGKNEYEEWLLTAIATKTLKIGVTAKTINKVMGENFIPVFNVQLSEPFEVTKENKKTGEYTKTKNWEKFKGKNVVITEKMNGNRLVLLKPEGMIDFYSRSGKVGEGFTELKEALDDLPTGIVYDGEVIAKNIWGYTNSNDVFQKTNSIMRSKGEKFGLQFHVFDMLPFENFKKGICTTSASKRKKALSKLVGKYDSDFLVDVPVLYEGIFDEDIMFKLLDEADEQGKEGIMIQLADGRYYCKRTKEILKCKKWKTADIRVLGCYEGEGEYEGSLGGFFCDYKGHRLKVGGGKMTHEMRKKFWDDQGSIIGKIIQIKFKEETVNQNGGLSVQFGTFEVIRDDKTEPSYY
jgi:DNA ligase-1